MPNIEALRAHIHTTSTALNRVYSKFFGSPFRHGIKQTHFCDQLERFADLYTGELLNLHNYPMNYVFISKLTWMEHEVS